MFGQNTNNVFGQPSAFGATTNAFGMNQNTQPQQTSLFGQPQQQTSLFGGTSTANTSSFFGNSAQNTSSFGAIQQPQANTFGTTNSLFGSSNLTQQNNNTSSLFGNNNNNAPSSFAMSTTNAFGTIATSAPNGTTIKYMAPTATDNMMKNGQQVTINIKLNCITCMREYDSKSIDELRLEDYAANRKGPSMGSTTTGGGLFGSAISNTGTSLFGQTNTSSTFGNNTTNSLFGNQQNKPSAFGSIAPSTSTTTNLFGTSTLNQNKPTGFGFGATNTTSTFGQPAQPQQQTSLFGGVTQQPQTNSLFGSTATQQPSLFGQTNQASTNLFSNNNQANQNKTFFGTNNSTFAPNNTATNSLFGATSNTGTGLFGNQPATVSSFGATTSQPSLFGSTNTSTANNTGAFGATKPIFGGFGTNSATTGFGTSASTSNLFGTSNAGTTNAFGSTNQSTGQTGLFGAATTSTFGTGATNTGFGATNTGATPFSFGTSNTGFNSTANNNTTGNAFGSFGNTNTGFGSSAFGSGSTSLFGSSLNTNSAFNAQQQQQPQQASLPLGNSFNTQQLLTRLETMPYGAMPQLPVDTSFQTSAIKTKFTTNPKTLNQYKINAKSQQNNVSGILRIPTSIKPANLLFDGLDDENIDSTKCANDIFSPRTSVKKLVLNKKGDMSLTPQSIKNLFSPKVNKFSTSQLLLDSTPKMESTRIVANSPPAVTPTKNSFVHDKMTEIEQRERKQIVQTPENNIPNISLNGSSDFGKIFQTESGDDSLLFGADETDQNCSVPNCGIILTRPEYFTIPSLEECDEYYNPQDDTCVVDNFTVTRTNYGSIFWPGPLDVKGLNLDEIVHIRRKEAIVYPDDDVKPPLNHGLNRPAQITLDQVWPINKSTRTPIKNPEILANYTERLEAATHRLDATFKEYRPETGSWVFTVKHFSKYGLEDDDEDVDMEPQKVTGIENLKSVTKEFNQETFVSKSNLNLNASLQDKNKFVLRERNGFLQDEHEPEVNFDKIQKPIQKNAEIEMMQNVLFTNDDDEEDEDRDTDSPNAAKKAKSSSFIKSQTAMTKVFSSIPIIPSSLRSSNVKKRVLRINSHFDKARANINSLHMASCSKVQFLNGSNRFCFVSGKSVFIMDCDIANIDTPENVDKLREHLNREILVKPSIPSIPEQRKCCEFVLSNGLSQSMTELIEALFGQLNEQFPYARYQERLQRIKKWLISFNKRLEVPMNDSWTRILHFLTTNEIEFAVTECQNSRNFRLGFLVASCAARDRTEKLTTLLDLWKTKKYDTNIDMELLKVYILLAGKLEWTTSDGRLIRVLENLNWTQQLLLILLYCEETASEDDLFALNPLSLSMAKMLAQPNDVEFHLLAQHSPWIVLSCSDMFLNLNSWFIHETLVSYNVIPHDWNSSLSDSIYLYMASQMTDLRWSIYFVVHVHNELVRYRFVYDLLIQNAQQLFDADVESFLTDNFHIDEKLILEAKRVYSKTKKNHKVTERSLFENDHFTQTPHRLLATK